MDHFKSTVDEKSIKVGRKQHVISNDNYVILLSIKDGLTYMGISPYSEGKWDALPHPV